MTRRIRLAILLLLTGFCSNGQAISDGAINAFAVSYAAETAKDYDKAITAVKSVYAETFYEANLRLGWLYYQNKSYEQSFTYYRQSVKLRPNSIEALFGLVYPAAALQKWAEVFSAYQAILSIDGNNSLANYRIALMYFYRKEFGSAEKRLQTVIQHYPFDYDSILLMAQVKLAMGKLGESKIYYQKALLYNPTNEAIKAVISKF